MCFGGKIDRLTIFFVRKMVEDAVDMKGMIERVLEETENSENRAAKMDVNDLLKCVVLLVSSSELY